MMFTPQHEIWKFAYAGELDDCLPYAEDLVIRWAGQSRDEIKFGTTFDIILAGLMCMDDLLPASARQAFAKLVLDVINEVGERKLAMDCLYIKPPPPGRKEDRRALGYRILSVNLLIKQGLTKSQAYEIVAKTVHKSVDTVRRDCERAIKRRRNRKGGEITG